MQRDATECTDEGTQPAGPLPSTLSAKTSASFESLIAEGDPLTPPDWNEQKEWEMRAMREQVRKRTEEECGGISCWEERMKRDPEYWKRFSPGGIR